MSRNYQIVIPLLILAICGVGCGLFSSDSGDADVVFAATEVGSPAGDKVTKDIGPSGGALASPDGRMTLTVPPNALTETTAFSMQPITNKAGNGLGLAYRLEPDGMTFTTPLEITVRYDESDLAGTVPEALSIAYQDKQGAWHAQNSAKLDQAGKTLTISTTHFTDFAFIARLRMFPAESTVYVGDFESLEVVGCKEPSFLDYILGRASDCSSPEGRSSWKVHGEGTIESLPTGTGVMYKAPAKKPMPNVAWVFVDVVFGVWERENGTVTKVSKSFAAKITIVDRGYKATGQNLPTFYSGTVCSLDKPFTVTGNNGPLTYDFKFLPSGDGRSGTGTMSGGYGGVTWKGSGTYTVEGFDGDKPRIIFASKSTASIPQTGASGSGTAHIDLVPNEGKECD